MAESMVWGSEVWEKGPRVQESTLTRGMWEICLVIEGSLEFSSVQLPEFSSVQSVLSCVQLFATPWTAARQASLSITNSRNLLKLMSVVLVMPSNYLILCHPLLLPSIFPSIRIFSNESVLRIRFRSVYF